MEIVGGHGGRVGDWGVFALLAGAVRREAGTGLGAGRDVIPAASAGMTELARAGMTELARAVWRSFLRGVAELVLRGCGGAFSCG